MFKGLIKFSSSVCTALSLPFVFTVPTWTWSCHRWRKARPALHLTCRQNQNKSSRNASSPHSETKADPLRSGKTRRRMASRGTSDREMMMTDAEQHRHFYTAKTEELDKHFSEKLALISSCCSVGVDVQFKYDHNIFYIKKNKAKMETANFCQLKCYRQFGSRD